MTINPRDYDIDELRTAAGVSSSAGAPPVASRVRAMFEAIAPSSDRRSRLRPLSDVAFRGGMSGSLARRAMAAPASATDRPYLDTVPESYAATMTVFEWLDYLVRRAGEPGARDAIEYYERLDWIAPEVADALREHLVGITPPTIGSGPLTVDDHLVSLEYVAQLAAVDEPVTRP